MTTTKPDQRRKAYIPAGCDQQGRLQTGRFLQTDPADLDDAKRSTQAGAGFAVVLAVAVLAACAGLWSLASMGVLR